jgi:hypothetical protein
MQVRPSLECPAHRQQGTASNAQMLFTGIMYVINNTAIVEKQVQQHQEKSHADAALDRMATSAPTHAVTPASALLTVKMA